jgi:hypothetical protein
MKLSIYKDWECVEKNIELDKDKIIWLILDEFFPGAEYKGYPNDSFEVGEKRLCEWYSFNIFAINNE